MFWGLVEMMYGLVNASLGQAVKMIFFAPWTLEQV